MRAWYIPLTCFFAAAAFAADQDILVADFEGRTYGDWKTEGEAFGPGPAQGTLSNQMQVSGFEGKGLVNSFYRGDATTGRLTSPPFKIERKFISFLIGGGMDEQKLRIDLLLEGKAVRTATGPNDKPGGSERLDWHSWDVADLAGKMVTIEIVDQATGGWGHINIDQIIQSDRKRGAVLRAQIRQIVAEKQYLNLPVKNGAPKRRMGVAVGGKTVREFEIELADADPDFWVFLDISTFKGETLALKVDRIAEDSKAIASIEQADTIKGDENLYREKLRPQFHFTSRRGWLNDPNGLVYHKGEYHLYYQHNPYGWGWGNMHWGHAVSKDLVHWQELPIAIYNHRFGDWAFSGSAVVDKDNTAGFKAGDEDVIVAAYTSTGRGECIVYSNDRGRTFTEYEGNPVVKHSGRDPKIIWYKPGKHWVMAVYDEPEGKRGIAFYTSPNLKNWTRQSYLDGYFECPEIFELPIDADQSKMKWIIYAADGAYAVGSFDGRTFIVESGKHRANWGNAFYASQTYSDMPDDRRIRIGWGQVATPGMPFNQMMNFPVELTLRSTAEGPRLFAWPVREIEAIHVARQRAANLAIDEKPTPLPGIDMDLMDVALEIDTGQATELTLNLRGVPIVYDVQKRQLTCHGKTATLRAGNRLLELRVLVDRTSLEVFADKGLIYMPIGAILKDSERSVVVSARGKGAVIRAMDVRELKSIWPAP